MDARIETYRRELLRWNARVNLIGPEAERNLDEHIEEALAAAALLRPEGEVLDFGSGGGLPAIPMAIAAPAARFHLVEADQKKWAFLKHVIRECELSAHAYGDRLDRVLPRLPRQLRFSLVTSRAVGDAEKWLPLLSGHVTDGATVALFQGNADAPSVRGFEPGAVHELPRGDANFLVTLTFHVEQ